MKEVNIEAPEGYEIDKENSTFECIKFKKKVKEYPSRVIDLEVRQCWWVSNNDAREDNHPRQFNDLSDLNTEEQAEAILALCQLIRLRDAWNEIDGLDWAPNDTIPSYVVENYAGKLEVDSCYNQNHILYFKDEETADRFLNDKEIRPLIETAKMFL